MVRPTDSFRQSWSGYISFALISVVDISQRRLCLYQVSVHLVGYKQRENSVVSVHLVVNRRVRGKTMSKPLLISCHLNYKDFITLAICLPITSLLLLLPSSVYRFSPYFFITAFILSAVGRTAPYSFLQSRLITSILLTFIFH